MPDFDGGFKIAARVSGRQLGRVGGMRCEEWEAIGDTLQTTERLADRAFRAREGGDQFVVYFEAYTRWNAAAPWSVLAKSGLLSERERLPTRSLIFVLLPQGYHAQGGQFRLQAAGAPTQHIWFREVCLWKEHPQRWWERAPGLMALYPLCRHDRPERDAITHAASRIAAAVRDRHVRADLLTTLSIFGKLVYPHLNVIDLIGREQMKESKFFEEVMHEGGVISRREDVLRVLTVRFGKEAAAEFQGPLEGVADLDRLGELLDAAIKSRRIAQFRRALAAGPGT